MLHGWNNVSAHVQTAVVATDPIVSLRATILLGELLNMSALLLPPAYAVLYNTLAVLTLASTSQGSLSMTP